MSKVAGGATVETSLLLAAHRALFGAITWLTNLESGSHAAKLPSVDIGDYMPNNIAGRPRMQEIAELLRVRAECDEHADAPLLNEVEQIGLALAYTAVHEEWGRNGATKPEHLRAAWLDLKIVQIDAEDNASFLMDMRQPDGSTRRVRITAEEV